MRRFPRHPLCILIAAVFFAMIAGSEAVRAQQSGQAADPAPPVLQFPAAGIGLEEAVRLTMLHDPGIQRAEADAAFRGGVAQQQSGLFDVTFSGSASYSRRMQELTASAKADQQKKRDGLQELIDAGPEKIGLAQEVRDVVAGIQNGTATPAQLTEISPTLAATLVTVDALIATASTPELMRQLQDIRKQVLADALRVADAELTGQKDIVATAQRELTNIGPSPKDEEFVDVTLDFKFSKAFRSGVHLEPFFDGTYNSTDFRGKAHQVEFGGKGLTDLYNFRAGVNVLLPLARGRGAAAFAAPERAAGIEHEGSLLALEHRRAASVLATVRAYWSLRAAQETAEISQQSLAFQQQLVSLIQVLVNAGDLAGVELARAQAAEARARADLDDASRRLRDARVGLAIAMGVGAGPDDSALPRARDPFPASPATAAAPGLVDEALGLRQDLGAATRFEEAGQVLARGAQLDLRPLFDLNVSTWYTALEEGVASKALDRWVGPSASISAHFEKPLGNNAAEGQLAQREAEARQRSIDQADLARQIQLRVLQSSSTLQQSVTQVEQARAAVGFYQTTIDAEMARLRAGDATVLDTIVTQQQQIGARLGLVAAELELAQRIIDLRFQTGTLVTGGAVRAQDLVTVPGGGRQ